jgi:cellulose synthase/poly-beta-1,6-N-acetylglucosamine synthase-like glycosyltransferase
MRNFKQDGLIMIYYIGYVCAFLAIASSVMGLRAVFAFRSHIKNWTPPKPRKYPAVTIISPQRGSINPDNINAVLQQKYPGAREIIFVTTQADASLPQLQQYLTGYENVKIAIAEDVVQLAKTKNIHRCQKNNNLLTAIQLAAPKTQVYVIVDADARPFNDWLGNLVAPLAEGDDNLGAVTSARIYIPGKGLASLVQALWTLISASFLVGKYPYIWGGGLAVPRKVFEEANLSHSINGQGGRSITNEDMNIYFALQEQGYKTFFVPECIVPRHPPLKKEKLLDVIKFTNRQLLQVWWTSKALWLLSLAIGVRLPLLICALTIAWWYPFCLVALFSIAIDTVMGIIALQTIIKAEPRFNVRMVFGKLKIRMFQPDRQLAPSLKIDVGFWVLLLPIITPLVVTINAFTVPFAKEMRWGGVAYNRRKVVGYTDNSSWRADV